MNLKEEKQSLRTNTFNGYLGYKDSF